MKALIPIVSMILLCSCNTSNEPGNPRPVVEIPEGFPVLPVPDDNPITTEKTVLGRELFFEKSLSLDSSLACASCHLPELGFANSGSKLATGFDGDRLMRNVLPLFNTAYYEELLWDGRAHSIEDIAFHTLILPVEFNNDTTEIRKRLSNNTEYMKLFKEAFGKDAQPDANNISKAVASYIRTLISGNSRYDKYNRGDENALNEQEKRGLELFFSDRTRCSECHSGILFTDGKFHSTGTTTHYFDFGRYYATKDHYDKGKFRTPSLRNIELTFPYMHDGEMETLEDVLFHYNRGGLPFMNRDTLLRSLGLTEQEKQDIIAFLMTLSDNEFINKQTTEVR